MIFDIKDIYTYNKINSTPMLSTFTSAAGASDFWKPYKDNFAWFDRMFMKKYRSWYPMDQDGELDDIVDEFADDVKSWLMINDKRYSELYRMQTIPDDEKYSLTDNVSEHEVIETEYGKVETYNKGSQQITDSGTATYGAHTDTQDNSRTYGAHTDTQDNSKTYGAHTDTQDNSRTYGEQQIDTDATNTTGATGKTITDSTSAFNDSGFANVDKTEEENDSRQDTVDQTVTNGAHTDTEDLSTTYGTHTDTEDLSTTYGTHTDTEDLSTTYGTHTDTSGNTRTDGARSDTTSDTGTDTTTRDRAGNIGVRTVDEMLTIHKDTWVNFSFYEFIFAEITRELLRGGVY